MTEKNRAKAQAKKPTEQDVAMARVFATSDRWRYGFAAFTKVGLGVCAAYSIGQLAGKNTHAFLSLVFSFDLSKYAFMGLCVVLGLGWTWERRLRKKEVRELSVRVKDYEIIIDGNRSSSMLSPDGTPYAINAGTARQQLPEGSKR